MISMTPLGLDHFVVEFDRPGRVEITTTEDGDIIAFVYEGTKWDREQEALGMYDGTIDKNIPWKE